MERLWQGFTKEDNVRLHQSIARLPDTMWNLHLQHQLLHFVSGVLCLTIDASLRGETAVCLDNLVGGHAGPSLEAVDVLGEESEEEVLLREQGDEGMRHGGKELAGVKLFGKYIKGLRVPAEVGNVKDSLGVRQV